MKSRVVFLLAVLLGSLIESVRSLTGDGTLVVAFGLLLFFVLIVIISSERLIVAHLRRRRIKRLSSL